MIAIGQRTDAAIYGFYIAFLIEDIAKFCKKTELFHSPYCGCIAQERVHLAASLQLVMVMYEREGKVNVANGGSGG